MSVEIIFFIFGVLSGIILCWLLRPKIKTGGTLHVDNSVPGGVPSLYLEIADFESIRTGTHVTFNLHHISQK